MKYILTVVLAFGSLTTFASELCTTGHLNAAGKVTQYGSHEASLKECLKHANDLTRSMNARGSQSILVVQHPGIGDSQILIKVEGKQDLSNLEN